MLAAVLSWSMRRVAVADSGNPAAAGTTATCVVVHAAVTAVIAKTTAIRRIIRFDKLNITILSIR
ncbi:hypothetical protein GCM10027277_51780 [Pseudoduganella ginsengisoli]